MPAALLLPTFLLILTLAASGVSKMLDLTSAPATLRALRLTRLPAHTTVGATAALEIVAAAALLVSAGDAFSAVAAAAFGLLLLFLAVGLRAQALDSTDDCGCFGKLASTRVGPWMTARNLALVIASGWLFLAASVDAPSASAGATMLADPAVGLALVVALSAAATVGASLRSGGPAPRGVTLPDAALLAPDGSVVVPRQRALRGRAQLLVFVRRGCRPCEDLIDRLTRDHDRLSALVDVRIIVPVGDGLRLDEPESAMHVDPSGEFAMTHGIPGDRPAAFLLTTRGEILPPIAVGATQTDTLVERVLAAADAS